MAKSELYILETFDWLSWYILQVKSLSFGSQFPDAPLEEEEEERPPVANDDDIADENNGRRRSKRNKERPKGWYEDTIDGWGSETIVSDDEADLQVDFATGRGNDWFNHACEYYRHFLEKAS